MFSLRWGYLVCALVIPWVSHGATAISRLQAWTQPFWRLMLVVPLVHGLAQQPGMFADVLHCPGAQAQREGQAAGFSLPLFGAGLTLDQGRGHLVARLHPRSPQAYEGELRQPDFQHTHCAGLTTLGSMTLETPSSPSAAQAPASLDDATLAFADKVFDAARTGDAGSLAQWLAAGLPPDLRNAKGDSLLMLASYHGHAAAAVLLLRHGADAALANLRGQTPLAGVAFKGDLTMAQLLLDHGAGVDSPSPDGRTPLMFAAMFNRLDIMQLLIARGAQVDASDAQGTTALGCALAMGAQEAAAMLRGPAG